MVHVVDTRYIREASHIYGISDFSQSRLAISAEPHLYALSDHLDWYSSSAHFSGVFCVWHPVFGRAVDDTRKVDCDIHR